jgi:hypothetical protein
LNVINGFLLASLQINTEEGGENVKYVKFWDAAIVKWQQLLAAMEATPTKYPTYLFGPHGIGQTLKGISVLEAETEDQLINYILALSPEFNVKFEPLLDAQKTVASYLKSKQ